MRLGGNEAGQNLPGGKSLGKMGSVRGEGSREGDAVSGEEAGRQRCRARGGAWKAFLGGQGLG